MLARALLVILIAGVAPACAPDQRAGDDDGTDLDASVVDASPFVDAIDPGDAPPSHGFTVYVHSKDVLYTMDPVTFALAEVGPFDAPGSDDITDLAVATDGTIFVISKTKLYRVSATTGKATFAASLSSGPSAGNVGLTFLPTGDLLATDSTGGVRRINPTSGLVTEIGEFGDGLATAGDLVAVDDGTMYAISDKAPGGGSAFDDNFLLTVNTTTGTGTPIGHIGAKQVFGAAFIDGSVLVFTKSGQIYAVDPVSGEGELRATHAVEFWGAGVTPLVPGVD